MYIGFPLYTCIYMGLMYVTQMDVCTVQTHMCPLVYRNAHRHVGFAVPVLYCTIHTGTVQCTVLYAHIIYTGQIAVLCRLLRRHVLYLYSKSRHSIWTVLYVRIIYKTNSRLSGGGEGAKSYDGEKAWSSINHSIRSGLTLLEYWLSRPAKKIYISIGYRIKKSKYRTRGSQKDVVYLGWPIRSSLVYEP